MLYKGYVETKGKKSIEKLKGRRKFKTFDEVKDLNGYGGVLADDTILIDIDEADQAEIREFADRVAEKIGREAAEKKNGKAESGQ